MAEALGGLVNAPHGLTCAISLPYMTRYNIPAVPEKTARIGQALGLSTEGMSVEDAANATVDALVDFNRRLDIPPMRSLGVTAKDIPKLVSIAMLNIGNADNPRKVKEQVFTSLYEEGLAK